MMKKKKIICIVLLVVAILVAIYFVWFKKPKEKETSLIELTGNSECIRINTEENVKVILKDVTFNCDKEPAIFIEKAGSVEIELNGNNSILNLLLHFQ